MQKDTITGNNILKTKKIWNPKSKTTTMLERNVYTKPATQNDLTTKVAVESLPRAFELCHWGINYYNLKTI